MAEHEVCPACDASAAGEWDEILRHFYCPTCSHVWRRARGKFVPAAPVQPLLPGVRPPMSLDNEWPGDDTPPPMPRGWR